MRIQAVAALFTDLRESELTIWVERGWVRPEPIGDAWTFHDIDIARVRLIHDLRHRMAVNDEALPLVLALLDQLYDLRGQVRALVRAVEQQPEDVRRAIQALL